LGIMNVFLVKLEGEEKDEEENEMVKIPRESF
jgi:hypothetical protein